MRIDVISAKKIKDSRGEYTIEVSVNRLVASSPSGKSKGKYETLPYHNSLEWSVKAINSFKEIKNIEIKSFDDLNKIENLIKKKFNLKNVKEFGANSLFALESAILKALAKSLKKELWCLINPNASKLPFPLGNAVGGGVHSYNKNKPEFQEFLLIPRERKFETNLKIMNETYLKLGKILKSKKKNDEGAWECNKSNEEILEILGKFKDIKIGIDVASSTFYRNENYYYKKRIFDRETQIRYINYLIDKYKIAYIEDPIFEEDFSGFSRIVKKSLVTGDDLTATNNKRLNEGLKLNSINAMIIKPNQNGSLVELKKIFENCRKNKIRTILSHRSGETIDSALADYAFGFQADYIKCGISGKEREVKLNRMVEIERGLRK